MKDSVTVQHLGNRIFLCVTHVHHFDRVITLSLQDALHLLSVMNIALRLDTGEAFLGHPLHELILLALYQERVLRLRNLVVVYFIILVH